MDRLARAYRGSVCRGEGVLRSDFRFLVRHYSKPCSRNSRADLGLRLFGDSSRLLDIWPSLTKSPILTHFSWSPLILAAIAANANVIHPALSSVTPSSFSPYSHSPPLSGLLALHIRRGDYVDHCMHIANWSARFMGFNEFPGLPDRFSPPVIGSAGNAPPEELERYRAHCFPEIAQIVTRVREVRSGLLSTTPLSRVYVLTNGRPEWLAELKAALQADARASGLDEWMHIGTSRDLRLTKEQQHNAQAMDMAVAQRAEVFLGNGVRWFRVSFLLGWC
jgi:hypothetical protein